MPSVCYTTSYCMQNCVSEYLVPVLLHRIDNFLAYVAALIVACVSKMSRTRGADKRTGDSKSPGRRIDFATPDFGVSVC